MKTIKEDEEYLDEKFPKGNKFRGEAMVLLALARIEGKKDIRKLKEQGKNERTRI